MRFGDFTQIPENLVDQILLDNPEIKIRLRDAGLSPGDLKEELNGAEGTDGAKASDGRAREIYRHVSRERAARQRVSKHLDERRKILASANIALRQAMKIGAVAWVVLFAAIYLPESLNQPEELNLPVAASLYGFINDVLNIDIAGNFIGDIAASPAGSAAAVATLIVLAWIGYRQGQITRESRNSLASQNLDNSDELDRKFEEAQARLLGGVTEQVELEINRIIAETEDYYSAFLDPFDARPLGQVHDPDHDVESGNRRDLVNRVESLESSSIGISGPRGAGKTTLIRSICSDAYTGFAPLETVAFWTSVPVSFEPRDFILHLFQKLCREFLSYCGLPPEKIRAAEDPALMSDAPNSDVYLAISILTAVGFFLFFGGLLIPSLLPLLDTSDTAGPLAAILNADWGKAPLSSLQSMLLGAVLMLGGFIVKRFYGRNFKAGRRLGEALPSGLSDETRELCNDAIRHLRDIKFQQSFSSGFSGGLKLPPGVSFGINRGVSFSQRSTSLPDLIDSFKEFAEKITSGQAAGVRGRPLNRKVIIGIDELDKMYADEDALKFLNGLKAIFWIRGCFFLLSVSESAMSKFERRGLPVRDAFDSSFDDVVRLNYFNLSLSKALLRRRIGSRFGVPFICLCHMVSGGLPRDLVRVATALSDFAPAPDADTLPRLDQVALTLLSREIVKKIEAARLELGRTVSSEHSRVLLNSLAALDTVDWTKEEMHRASDNILDNAETLSAALKKALSQASAQANHVQDIQDLTQAEALARQLGVYIFIAATIVEYFDKLVPKSAKSGHDDRLRKELATIEDQTIEHLARAKQLLAVDLTAAQAAVEQFRTKTGLSQSQSGTPCPPAANKRSAEAKP